MKAIWCFLLASAVYVPLCFVVPKLAMAMLWVLVVAAPWILCWGIRSACADDVEDAE